MAIDRRRRKLQARVAELADALDLGSSAARRPGSTPGSRILKSPRVLVGLCRKLFGRWGGIGVISFAVWPQVPPRPTSFPVKSIAATAFLKHWPRSKPYVQRRGCLMTDCRHGDPRFEALLADDFDAAALENDGGTIYGLWPAFNLAFFNSGWLRFAALNDGEPQISVQWPLGRCVLEAIAEPLRPFFVENYGRCLREGRPWEHAYECSSPEVYRQFHMTAFPLGNAEGLLVVNSLRREVPHTRVPCPPLEELYRNDNGVVVQCCHCRRTRRAGTQNVWDWVPAWLSNRPASTSHGLCEPCMGFHYSDRQSDSGGIAEPFKTWS